MKARVKESDVLAFLRRVERGSVTLVADKPWTKRGGVVTYTSSDGWVVDVFNDCGRWDYVKRVVTEDGREVTYEDIKGEEGREWVMERVAEYVPPEEVQRKCYGVR